MRKAAITLFALFTIALSPSWGAIETGDVTRLFLSKENGVLAEYEGLRHLEASNNKTRASMDVVTKLSSGNIFSYKVTNEDGSRFIKNILRRVLDDERKQVKEFSRKSAYTEENYNFGQAENFGGLWKLPINPKKKEGFLINGHLMIGTDGELLRSEGMLVRNPSWLTRNTSVVITFESIEGVRLPVKVESVSDIRFVGKSFLSTRYSYSSVNGVRVGE